jgi:hypothetical protein
MAGASQRFAVPADARGMLFGSQPEGLQVVIHDK